MSRLMIGLVISAILVGISYFSAKLYAIGFRLDARGTSIVLLCFLTTAFLFTLSLMLARGGIGMFGSIVYSALQVLSGIALYVFLGAGVLAVILAGYALMGSTLPVWIAEVILIASLFIAGLGLVQAQFISVKEYSLILHGAPKTWEGKTAALVSDTHFGLVRSARFSKKVVQKIISLNPDLVLHAGDFYDGPHIDTTLISASWKTLVETVPVFYAPGNHEEYGNYDAFIASIKKAGIVVLEDSKVTYDGIDIAGFRYRGKGGDAAMESITKTIELSRTPSIAIVHSPIFHQTLADMGVDLVVSGHTHRGQFWPMNYLVRRLYGSYIYGTNTIGTSIALTTSGVGTFGPPFRLFNPPEIVLIHFKTK